LNAPRTVGWGWVVAWFGLAAALGAAGGAALRMLSMQTHTTVAQAIRPPFGGRTLVRILALGEDRPRGAVRGRSDTMIVAALDLNNHTIRAVSIPRDTRVYFPDRHDYDKINASHALGGPLASVRAAEDLLGVGIDYYAEVSIEGLKKAVDLLGGVEIDIEKNMRYVDRRGGLYINLRKGYRLLNGDQALQYVRFRHDALGDISRMQRQQKFLRAIARKSLMPGQFSKLPRVINEIMANVNTNMTGKDMLALARLAREVQPEELEMTTLPGHCESMRGISYYIADEEAAARTVDEMLRFLPPVPPAAAGRKPGNGSPAS